MAAPEAAPSTSVTPSASAAPKKPSETKPADSSSSDLIKKLTAKALAHQHKPEGAAPAQPTTQQVPPKAREEVAPQAAAPAPTLAEMPKAADPAAATDPITALLSGQGVD